MRVDTRNFGTLVKYYIIAATLRGIIVSVGIFLTHSCRFELKALMSIVRPST